LIERIPLPPRSEWLELRRRDITASDVAAICGLSPYKTALRVWAEKCGEVAEAEDNPSMKRGRWLEAAVFSALAEEKTEWVVKRPGIYVRDTEARIGATPDAIALTSEGDAVVQMKIVAKPVFDAWQGEPPIGYVLQTLTEAMLMDTQQAYLAAMVIDVFTADLHIFPVNRHPGAEAKIRETVARFWSDVEAGRMPAADYARDSDLLQELYPPREHVEPLDFSGDNRLPEILAERERLMADEKSVKARLDEIKAELVDKLHGAPAAICGEWKITQSITHRKEQIIKATSFPVLRISRVKQRKAA
jgi:putative phage-type endonuclease